MSGVPLNNVLTELLHATNTGMCTMRFSPVCERCGSPTCASTGILANTKLPIMAYCRGCRFTSPIDCMEKIKVVFVLNTEILYVLAENLPCKPSNESLALSETYAMVPATFSGSGFRYSFGCDGDMMLRPAFSAGKYRMVSCFAGVGHGNNVFMIQAFSSSHARSYISLYNSTVQSPSAIASLWWSVMLQKLTNRTL